MIQANEIRFSYGSTTVIENATFQVEDGDKVGIVGPNGAGKTTLLRLITEQFRADAEKGFLPDSGTLHIRKNTEIGYLEQQVEPSDHTVFSFCEQIFSDIFLIEERMRVLEGEMARTSEKPADGRSCAGECTGGEKIGAGNTADYTGGDGASADGEKIMAEYGELLELFEDKGGYAIRSKVNSVLAGLKMDGEVRLSQLSGGERSKVAMARLLLRSPELLILDEPTNHLDIESITWMEEFLKDYAGTILVVSHDRYFLDRICTKILHFEFGRATMYRGGYKQVIRQIMEQKAAQMKAYELRQKEIARQEGIIREFYNRATEIQIKKAKSRQKMLDKMEKIEKPSEDRTVFHLKLKSSGRGGNDVLMLSDICKKFGERTILDHANLEVFRGDKIGLIGGNGAGKTTLFKIALGEVEADGGCVRHGSGIGIGYFSQNMETLDRNKSILEELHDSYPKLTVSEVRGALGAFLFKDDLDRTVGSISGGERSRLQLLKLMMSPANLLLLDEPTNHLDTYSKEMLDRAIADYEGTVVIISHDRFFLNAVCNKIALLRDGVITLYEGNYDDYLYTVTLRKQQAEQQERERRESEKKAREKAAARNRSKKQARGTDGMPKMSKKMLEKEITELENRIAELENLRYAEEVYSDFRKSREVEEEIEMLKNKCEELYELFLS